MSTLIFVILQIEYFEKIWKKGEKETEFSCTSLYGLFIDWTDLISFTLEW